MTSKQTGELKDGYGLGWATGGGTFGHGGAYATNMTIDASWWLITALLVQHADFAGDGAKSHGVLKKVAEERYTGRRNNRGPQVGGFNGWGFLNDGLRDDLRGVAGGGWPPRRDGR